MYLTGELVSLALRYLDVVGLSVLVGVLATVSAGVLNAGKLISPNSAMGVCCSAGNRLGIIAEAGCLVRLALGYEAVSTDSFGVHSSDLVLLDEEPIVLSS